MLNKSSSISLPTHLQQYVIDPDELLWLDVSLPSLGHLLHALDEEEVLPDSVAQLEVSQVVKETLDGCSLCFSLHRPLLIRSLEQRDDDKKKKNHIQCMTIQDFKNPHNNSGQEGSWHVVCTGSGGSDTCI